MTEEQAALLLLFLERIAIAAEGIDKSVAQLAACTTRDQMDSTTRTFWTAP